MKVSDLILALEKMPALAEIRVQSSEGVMEPIKEIVLQDVEQKDSILVIAASQY